MHWQIDSHSELVVHTWDFVDAGNVELHRDVKGAFALLPWAADVRLAVFGWSMEGFLCCELANMHGLSLVGQPKIGWGRLRNG